jgi:segregation and condensation protein B
VVQASLDELMASFSVEDRGIEVRCVAGGYKTYTKPQQHDVVRRFIKSLRPPLRLTMPALETLAVIAYKQPVTAPEISEIRGVNTSGVISTLLDKRLIMTAGRKEVMGRPILYKTSKEFLMRFGLSDLEELPSLKEFEALAREALGTDEGVASPEGASDEAEVASGEWRVASENQGDGTAGVEAGGRSGDRRSQEDGPTTEAEPDVIATGQELVVDGHQPVSEGDNMAMAKQGSKDETNTTAKTAAGGGASANSVPAADGDSRSTPSETIERVKEELAAAEEWREHEALATAEGMPAGELDEDPLPPNVKSTAAGE